MSSTRRARLGDLDAARAAARRWPSSTARCSSGWRTLAAEGPDAVADPWCRDHLDELAAAEARWEQVTRGDRLIHGDVRSDNVLLTGRRPRRVRRLDEHVHRRGLVRRAGDAAGGRARGRRRARVGAGPRRPGRPRRRDARAGRRRVRGLLRRTRPAPGSSGPADGPRVPARAGRGHRSRGCADCGTATDGHNVQCRPIPKSQSPFSSG